MGALESVSSLPEELHREKIVATSPLPSGPTWTTRRGAGLASDGLAEITTVALLGVRGPLTATTSQTACAAPSLSLLSSSARPSSAYYVATGPRTAGRTPSRTPTSYPQVRIALTTSTTTDSVRGTSTKRRYFWFVGLLALVLWCLEYSAFQTFAFRCAV